MILTACPLQNLTTNATAALTAGIARQKKWRKLKTRTTRQFLHVREGMLYLKLKTLKTFELLSTVTDANFSSDKTDRTLEKRHRGAKRELSDFYELRFSLLAVGISDFEQSHSYIHDMT